LVGFAIAALAAAKLLVGSGPKTGDYPH
jgi:hypothetical protein